MRCPSCEKFVSYDTEAEVELNVEIDEDGTVSGDARRVLTCGDCGDELKEYNFGIDATVEIDDAAKPEKKEPTEGEDGEEEECADGHKWESEDDEEAEPTMRVEDKDRHGKPIKRARYMRTYYGIEVNGTAKCATCGVTGHWSFSDEAMASSFDELV